MTLRDDIKRTSERIVKSGRKELYLILIVLFIASMTITIFSIDQFIEYSSLTIGLTKAFIGIMMLLFIDDIVFKEINTENEIKEKNYAYAIIYFANAIIISACLALS